MRCNGWNACTDSSDEIGCKCENDKFTCDCVMKGTCATVDRCKTKKELVDGFVRCPEQRILFRNKSKINIHRLRNVSECNDIGFPGCNKSTYHTHFPTCVDDNCYDSHVLCTSYCDQDLCRGVFQCSDNQTIFLSQFCDGVVDCLDGSDEFTNQPGFKCNKCVLPQSNLYDDVAHCENNSDLHPIKQYFKCFDNRLLLSDQQVCDGVGNCYDMSDECLCDEYFDTEMCASMFEDKNFQCFDNENRKLWGILLNDNPSIIITRRSTSGFVECRTKFNNSILAITCDGRPECRDFSDECQCSSPPLFCNDSCHSYFLMGDRYCDGVEDPAWQYINRSDCPRGFDETFCPKRFKCNATGKISIDVVNVCDRTSDCDDNSDENNCPIVTKISSIFSSDTEMIANLGIKSAFWIMGILVMVGNSYVIITTISLLKIKQTLEGINCQHFIILNISIADFIMGIYLITIASYDASFSGFYGAVDREWRSSLKCSVIGSLAVISSEASCFLIVALTSFRLKNITQPVKSLTASSHSWIICITTAWLFWHCSNVTPNISVFSSYLLVFKPIPKWHVVYH